MPIMPIMSDHASCLRGLNLASAFWTTPGMPFPVPLDSATRRPRAALNFEAN
jgi:hypothetical protein